MDNYMKKLVEYFKKNFKKGYTADALKFALIEQGYSKIAVEQALAKATKELAEQAPVLKAKPVIKYEILDEDNRPIKIKKSFLKRLFEI